MGSMKLSVYHQVLTTPDYKYLVLNLERISVLLFDFVDNYSICKENREKASRCDFWNKRRRNTAEQKISRLDTVIDRNLLPSCIPVCCKAERMS